MTLKTNIKAGALRWNHNETSMERTRGLKIKTSVKAGSDSCPQCRGDLINNTLHNHNETQVQRTRGFHVKSGVKAGPRLTTGDRFFFTHAG